MDHNPLVKGPEDFFADSVRIDSLFEPKKITHTQGALVTFEPGAHTPWHTHSLGQTLIVVSGCGWAQSLGQPIVEIHPGI
jgi:quercetin dioxygenase-like cupin family protein